MKTCLIVLANPSLTSFSAALADEFKKGLQAAGHNYETIHLFQENYPLEHDQYHNDDCQNDIYRMQIKKCDGIAFAFPWWWEMPPYPMVAFYQSIFTKDFAYTYENGVKTEVIDLPVQLLISMGQSKHCNLTNLVDAMEYCGLHLIDEVVCQNVGPNLHELDAEKYLTRAWMAGYEFFPKQQ